jgi:outer membrane murein-binding lipoprotein Lpp
MNYNSMSDFELLHYLDLYSDDPVIRRLVNFLSNTRGGLITDLEAAGMDPHTWQFETEWQHMYPGDYIQQLRGDLEEAESDLEHTKYKLEEAETELNEMKTRSIMDFVQEVWQEKKEATYKVHEALKEAKAQKEENARLKEQIDMWAAMNRIS